MRRKDFVKLFGTAALLPSIPSVFASHPDIAVIKPARIKKGDKIGLAAPGGYITEDELRQSVENLSSLGFNAVPSDNILKRYGYLAGEDKTRADDLNKLFARKDIKAIMCARGGYGCARILPFLDYELVKKNPKILVGYSDVTALLFGIFSKTGLIGFHGPVGISTFNEFSIRYFNDVLINPYPGLDLISARDPQTSTTLKTIKSGKASGILAGGNLSIVVSLIGTPYDVDMRGKIVFLEEINEEPYRIDRMLTQMIQAGKFTGAAGVALGVFHKCEPKEKDPEFPKSFTLFEVLEDRLFGLGVPVLYGLSFGHITNKFTLPFGLYAELDSDNQILRLLEPAVL